MPHAKLPHNMPAERAVLGCVLVEPSQLHEVSVLLSPEMFWNQEHRAIYISILDLYNASQPIDLVSVFDHICRKQPEHAKIAASKISDLAMDCPAPSNAKYYAEAVRGKAILRDMLFATTEISDSATNPALELDEVLSIAERRIIGIVERRAVGDISELPTEIIAAWTRLEQRKITGHVPGVPTGFRDLDDILGGMRPGEFCILAARPSVGKTCVALNIAHHCRCALFVSLEQSAEELTERLLCSTSGIDSHRLRTARIGPDDIVKLHDACASLRGVKLFIDDTAGRKVSHIGAQARRIQMRHDIRLVVVDYIQLIDPEDRKQPRHEQVGQISRRLKLLARELNLPILALSQLNRASEDRDDKKPRLSDLRSSGELEQDADVVLLMHRPSGDDNGQPSRETVIQVAKHRNGPTGEVTLQFQPERMRFVDQVKNRPPL